MSIKSDGLICKYFVNDGFIKERNSRAEFYDILCDLEKRLIAQGVSRVKFSLGESDVDERYCLSLDEGFWWVYYSERGRRSSACLFSRLNDATLFFFTMLANSK